MKGILLFVAGAVVFGITFAAWYWLNALACGMNTTGCKGVTLHWADWEALRFFVPTFLLGLALMIAGGWRFLVRQRS